MNLINQKWLMTNMTEAATGLPMGGRKVARTALFDWGGVHGSIISGESMLPTSIKVGILAVSENWLTSCSQLNPGEIIYEDYIQSAKKAAIDLRARGAEIVLAITHNRLENDYKLTEAVPEIDLLLGGHDHFYKEDLAHRIIKSGEEWRWTSHVTICLEKGVKKPVVTLERLNVTTTTEENPQIKALCQKYKSLEQKKFSRVIYTTGCDMVSIIMTIIRIIIVIYF